MKKNISPLIKGGPAYAEVPEKEDLVVPKLDKEELDKLLKEREERLAKESKKDIKKPQWPEELTDLFKGLNQTYERGIRPPNSKKLRTLTTKRKKTIKKQQRGK